MRSPEATTATAGLAANNTEEMKKRSPLKKGYPGHPPLTTSPAFRVQGRIGDHEAPVLATLLQRPKVTGDTGEQQQHQQQQQQQQEHQHHQQQREVDQAVGIKVPRAQTAAGAATNDESAGRPRSTTDAAGDMTGTRSGGYAHFARGVGDESKVDDWDGPYASSSPSPALRCHGDDGGDGIPLSAGTVCSNSSYLLPFALSVAPADDVSRVPATNPPEELAPAAAAAPSLRPTLNMQCKAPRSTPSALSNGESLLDCNCPATPEAVTTAAATASASPLPPPPSLSLSPADNVESPAPSAPWLVERALSVKAAVEEAVRGVISSSGGIGTAGAASDGEGCVDVNAPAARETVGEKAPELAGWGGGGQGSATTAFPDEVIGKVPRLVADLHAALGRSVSSSEAKAWVRALDRLGEGLDREKLLEACLDVSRDVLRVERSPSPSPSVRGASSATPASLSAVASEASAPEPGPANGAVVGSEATEAVEGAVRGNRSRALDVLRPDKAGVNTSETAAATTTSLSSVLVRPVPPVETSVVSPSSAAPLEAVAAEADNAAAPGSPEVLSKGKGRAAAMGLRLVEHSAIAATAKPPPSSPKKPGSLAEGNSSAAVDGQNASEGINPPRGLLPPTNGRRSATLVPVEDSGAASASVVAAGGREEEGEEAELEAAGAVGAATAAAAAATPHDDDIAAVGGVGGCGVLRSSGRDAGRGDGGDGSGAATPRGVVGGGAAATGGRQGARRNASKFPDDVIAKVPCLSADLHATLGRYVSLQEVKDIVRRLRRRGAGMDRQALLDGCLELLDKSGSGSGSLRPASGSAGTVAMAAEAAEAAAVSPPPPKDRRKAGVDESASTRPVADKERGEFATAVAASSCICASPPFGGTGAGEEGAASAEEKTKTPVAARPPKRRRGRPSSNEGIGGDGGGDVVAGVRTPASKKAAKSAVMGSSDSRTPGAAGGAAGSAADPPPRRMSKRARQPCGLIPESVIAKVPRLLMDLETFLGYRVFADDAKARCRELDCCGEGLSQEELCDAVVSLLRRQAPRNDTGSATGVGDTDGGGGGSNGHGGSKRKEVIQEEGEEGEEEQEEDHEKCRQDEAEKHGRHPLTPQRLPARFPQRLAARSFAAGSEPPGISRRAVGGGTNVKQTEDGGSAAAVAVEDEDEDEDEEEGEQGEIVAGESSSWCLDNDGGGGVRATPSPRRSPRQQHRNQHRDPPEALAAGVSKSESPSAAGAPAAAAGDGASSDLGKGREGANETWEEMEVDKPGPAENRTSWGQRKGDAENGNHRVRGAGADAGGGRSGGAVARTPTLKKRPRRSSGIFPESVISKIPRLTLDLSTRLGWGVSTEQAKAACRELDRCGERLTPDELAEACAGRLLKACPGARDVEGQEEEEDAAESPQSSSPPPPPPPASPPPLAPVAAESPDQIGRQAPIPDSVIAKLPRLALDLEPFTGRPVSVEEAKAGVRKLEGCGENLTQQELCDAYVCRVICGDDGGAGDVAVSDRNGGDASSVNGSRDGSGNNPPRLSISPEGPRIDVRSQAPTPAELLPDRELSGFLRLRHDGGLGSVKPGEEEGRCFHQGVTGRVSREVGRGTPASSSQQQQQRSLGVSRNGGGKRDNKKDATRAVATAAAGAPVGGGKESKRAKNGSSSGGGGGDKVNREPLLSKDPLECDVGEFVVFPTPRTSPVPFLLGKILEKRVLTFKETGGPVRTEVTVHWFTPKKEPTAAAAIPAPAGNGVLGRGERVGATEVAASAAAAVAGYTSGGWSGVFVPGGAGKGKGGAKRLKSDTGEEDLAAAMVVFPRLLQSNGAMPASVRDAVSKAVVAAAVAADAKESREQQRKQARPHKKKAGDRRGGGMKKKRQQQQQQQLNGNNNNNNNNNKGGYKRGVMQGKAGGAQKRVSHKGPGSAAMGGGRRNEDGAVAAAAGQNSAASAEEWKTDDSADDFE